MFRPSLVLSCCWHTRQASGPAKLNLGWFFFSGNGWCHINRSPTIPLGEVADIVRGVSFDKSEVLDTPRSGYVPILRAGNIATKLNTCDDLVWVPEARVGVEQFLKRDDVAICMSSGSPAVVGKTAQLTSDWRGSVGAFCAIIRFRDLNPRFGAYWLRSPGFMAWRDSQAQGANIQNLRKAELDRLPIPLPPLAEQARIVQLLDEVEALRRLRTQSDRRTADLIPSLFDQMFGEGKDFPSRKLVEICGFITKGTTPRACDIKDNGDPGDIPFLKVYSITDAGSIEFHSVPSFISKHLHEGLLARSKVYPNDVLMNIVGPPLGKIGIVPPEYPEWNINQAIAIFRQR